MRVDVAGLSVDIDRTRIVSDVTLSVPRGGWLGLLGPNGSGKSTLLRSLYRVLRPCAGAVRLDERDLWADLDARSSARRTAVVAQESSSDFAFSVREVVRTGRLPHQRMFAADTAEDRDIVEDAIARVGMSRLAGRVFATLSGGEKQRVLLARALCQRSQILILDEPTNHLDVRAQFELLELAREAGVTTIAALHDLNLAVAYCDTVCVMVDGAVVAAGDVETVLRPELIERVFGVRAGVGVHPLTGRPTLALAPLPRLADAGPPSVSGATPAAAGPVHAHPNAPAKSGPASSGPAMSRPASSRPANPSLVSDVPHLPEGAR